MAVAAATGLVFLSTPAFAWNQVWYKDRAHVIASGKRIVVEDTACDNYEVKGKWKYKNESDAPMYSKNNGSGCNTQVVMDTAAVIHGIQARVVRPVFPDNCSTWKYWQ
jgi:hypothetical protein